MEIIFHIARQPAWKSALKSGSFSADSLESEGFLHCSTADQVMDTVNARFQGVQDLMLLCIDPRRLEAELKYEPGRRANAARTIEPFPHIFGPLNLSAVVRTVALTPNAEGRFEMPEEIGELKGS